MLSKCANPTCPTTFRYLHEGRLYVIDRGEVASWAQAEMLKQVSATRIRLVVLLLLSVFDDSN
jgi:hypothetical protein